MSSALDDILGNKPTPLPPQQPQPTQQPTEAKPLVDWNKAGVNLGFEASYSAPAILQQQEKEKAEANKIVPPLAPPPEQPKAQSEVKTEAKTPAIPEKERRMSYVDMFKQLNPYQPPTQEELEKERKKEKRERMFAAIGDGISALSNLYFTTQYAPNMYNPENSQSKRVESKWEKLRQDRDAQMNAYIKNLMAAQQADDENAENERKWQRQLGIDAYNQKKDADALQYKKDRDNVKDDQWQKSYDQKADQFETTTEIKKAAQKEAERSHRANEGLKGAQIAEAGRHNRVSEAQGAARISQAESHFRATHNADGTTKSSAKDNGYHLTIGGKTYTYETESDYNKAVVKEARKRGLTLTWGTSKNKYGIVSGTPKLRTIVGLASELEEKFGGEPNQAKSTSTGGFNANNYRRNRTKPTAKQTTTNKPPLN